MSGPSHRIDPRPGEVLDRGRSLRFRFGGREYRGCAGDTIASALAAAGVSLFSRSFKYHRPRGLLCCAGHCPNCLVQVDSEPNVRACTRPLEEDMAVWPQNVWPSLKLDLMALTERLSRFLPAGFYYKTFIRPKRLWPLYDRVLRTAAGLGTVDERTPEGEYDKRYLHADVVVAGGGPAGLSAALAARESGARVLLLDENPAVGGHLRYSGRTPRAELDAAGERLDQAGVEVLTGTSATGWYQDHWLSAARGQRLFKIRARAVVVATGSHEIPPLFDGNDRPGVMLGTAAQRLLRLYGVAPGRRAVVVTAGDGGWEVAADLLAAGVEVAAVADERPGAEPPGAADLAASGTEVLSGYTIGEARGRRRVREAVLVPVSGAGDGRRVRCDLVAVSNGRQPSAELAWMAGAGSRYDEDHAEMRVVDLPEGVFLAGRVAGLQGPVEAEEEHGRRAGAAAADHALGAETAEAAEAGQALGAGRPEATESGQALGTGRPEAAGTTEAAGAGLGLGDDPQAAGSHSLGAGTAEAAGAAHAPGDDPAVTGDSPGEPHAAAAAHALGAGTPEAGQAPEAVAARPLAADPADAATDPPGADPSRSSALVSAPACAGGKRFVCLCEDVTDTDVETSLAEGYDHLELLKRYTTIGMGPCQGRMCNLHGIRLCAAGTGRSVQETGRTTARPPVTPLSLGTLAGQKMEPVQVSAMHDWHLAHGARLMTAGTWLRPERYGDPAEEVAAVRNGVGLIDVSPLGKLRLTGPGVPDLLERLYVNSWRDLRRGRVRYGMMCNDEGVILDDGVCARLADDDWYVSTTSTGAAGALEWVEWWRQSGWGDGVHVTDLTEARAAVNLAGPASREVLQKLTSRDLSKAKFPYMRARRTRIAGLSCLVLRIGFTGELSYEIHGPSGGGQYLWEALMEAGAEHGIRPFGVEAQRILRLEKGHLIVGQDTDALSDAISADSAWAVKLEKKDFLGKRALTRVAETGSKQRLVGFRMTRDDAAVEEGLQIVTRRSRRGFDIIGWITSCRRSPTLGGTIGLCWLPADIAAEEGASFSVYAGGRLEEGRVHHGAFYDPGGERLRG